MIDGEQVRVRIAQFLRVPPARTTDDALLKSLVRESFQLIQLVMDLQEEFHVRLVQDDLREVTTVGQLIHQVVTHDI
jgi:acyl carrier protein